MGRISSIIAAVLCAASAIALPGDLVVLSAKEVRPDEAAGLYYLGSCAAGYLYNGSSAALGAVAPYRLLDGDAQAKDYYIVWAPEWVGITPEAFAQLGTTVRLSDTEILVGLEHGFGPGDLRAVEHRIELIKLEPVTPVDWKADAEAPPTKKDPRIAAAINTITAEEYARYIKRLQDFKTRWTETEGCDGARDWLRNYFAAQNLEASLFEFACVGFEDAFYPEPAKSIYVETDHQGLFLSRDLGRTWVLVHTAGVGYRPVLFFLKGGVGFVVGSYNVLATTVDGGETWEYRKIEYGERGRAYSWRAMCFVSGDVGWLAGTSYKLPKRSDPRTEMIRTADGGRTWRGLTVTGSFSAETIAFSDSKHGWAAEYAAPTRQGRILYTSDGGATWRECTRPPANKSVTDISPVGPVEAWAADSTNSLLRTKDGVTWEYVDTGASGGLYHVEFPDAKHGYAAHTELVATADGGQTWRRVSALPETVYSALAFADKDHGIIADYWGEYLLRTTDGARTFVDIKGNIDLYAENVVAERRGAEKPDEIVIIGGHYDSVSDDPGTLAPGAEDNASGTACALAAARAFRNTSFERTVRYVAFGDEEFGLNGSREYAEYCAAKGEKIVAVLNADMVSYDEENGGRDDLTIGAPNDAAWLVSYLEAVGALYGQKLIYDWDSDSISDDWSFTIVGYAALGVIEGGVGVGGGEEYPWYHSTEDTLDKLQPELGVRFVRDYAAMFAHLAGVGDSLLEPPPPGAAVPFSRAFAVYPNPFCYASTTGGVNFVGIKSPAKVQIYDLAGRRVASAVVAANTDEFVWRPGGEALSPGVYLYRVEGQEQEETGKIVISK